MENEIIWLQRGIQASPFNSPQFCCGLMILRESCSLSIFQKKHVTTMDALKKKHLEEKEELMSQTESLTTKVPRGVTPVTGQVKLFMVNQEVTAKLECFGNVPSQITSTELFLILFGRF